MNKCGLLEKFTRRKSVLSKESSTAPVASKQTISLLEKHLWTDETTLEMFDCNARHRIWLKKQNKGSISKQTHNINCQARWRRRDDLSLFLPPQDLRTLKLWSWHAVVCIPKYSRVLMRLYGVLCTVALFGDLPSINSPSILDSYCLLLSVSQASAVAIAIPIFHV